MVTTSPTATVFSATILDQRLRPEPNRHADHARPRQHRRDIDSDRGQKSQNRDTRKNDEYRSPHHRQQGTGARRRHRRFAIAVAAAQMALNRRIQNLINNRQNQKRQGNRQKGVQRPLPRRRADKTGDMTPPDRRAGDSRRAPYQGAYQERQNLPVRQ